MVIFNSYVSHYQRVSSDFLYLSIWNFNCFFFDFQLRASEDKWHDVSVSMVILKLHGSHGPLNVRWVPKILENQWWFLFHILFAIKLVSMAIRKKNRGYNPHTTGWSPPHQPRRLPICVYIIYITCKNMMCIHIHKHISIDRSIYLSIYLSIYMYRL